MPWPILGKIQRVPDPPSLTNVFLGGVHLVTLLYCLASVKSSLLSEKSQHGDNSASNFVLSMKTREFQWIQNETNVNIKKAEQWGMWRIGVCWLLGRVMELWGEVICPPKKHSCIDSPSWTPPPILSTIKIFLEQLGADRDRQDHCALPREIGSNVAFWVNKPTRVCLSRYAVRQELHVHLWRKKSLWVTIHSLRCSGIRV